MKWLLREEIESYMSLKAGKYCGQCHILKNDLMLLINWLKYFCMFSYILAAYSGHLFIRQQFHILCKKKVVGSFFL